MVPIPGAPSSFWIDHTTVRTSDVVGPGSTSATSPWSRITRSFVGYAEDESDCLRTHCHFQIFFTPDDRDVRLFFLPALEEMLNLGDDLVMSEAPGEEYLLSIPDKEHNRNAIEYLQDPHVRQLGNMSFRSVPADEDTAFLRSSAYDAHDVVATSHALVELRNLPLHLRTLRTVKRLLQPYCAVTELYPHPDNSVDRTCFKCFCWTDRTASIPTRIMVKVKRRLRSAVADLGQLALDMFIVLIRAVENPLQKNLCPFQELPPLPNLDEDIPHCFLQGTEVDEYEFGLLLRSLVLSKVDDSPSVNVKTLSAAIQKVLPVNKSLKVHQIAFDAFIVHCYNFPPFEEFKCDAVNKGEIILAGQLYNARAWCPAYGSTEVCIGRFLRIDLTTATRGLLQESIVAHVLSSFALLEHGYANDQAILAGDGYTTFGWIDNSIFVPDDINIYITPHRCQSSYSEDGRTYMRLYARRISLAVSPACLGRI